MMQQTSNNKRSCVGCFVSLLLLAVPSFLVLSGCLLLAVGEHVVGAIICIVVGAIALLIGAMLQFLKSHPGHRLAQGVLVGILSLIAGGVVCISLTVMLKFIFVQPWIDLEHCRRIADNPVFVTATVTHHSSYEDSDDDTRYQSHVTYVYEGERYVNRVYETRGNKKDLTALGKNVSLQISPEDPSKQVSTLRRNSWYVFALFPVLMMGCVALCMVLLSNKREKTAQDASDLEAVQRDLQTAVLERIWPVALLMLWLSYAFLAGRYSMVFGWIVWAATAACCIAWLCSVYVSVRDYGYAQRGEFELREDILVRKEYSSDSDGSSYVLNYQSGERTWTKSVNEKDFCLAREGDRVLAVYLPKKEKPILHYNMEHSAY